MKLVLLAGGAWSALVLLASYEYTRKSGGASVGWRLLTGARVRLELGRRYRAAVVVPWIVPTSMVRSAIGPKLTERGFTDVVVSAARPVGWPNVDADLWVEATWNKDAQVLDRPGAIASAWEQA